MEESDFDVVADTCMALRSRMVARKITRVYDQALVPCGLKVTQFTLLVSIAQAGRQSISELADLLAMERTTLSRNLKLLAQRGLIELDDTDKGRTRHVAITAQGRSMIGKALPYWRKAQKSIADDLGDNGFADSLRGLNRLIVKVGAHEPSNGAPTAATPPAE